MSVRNIGLTFAGLNEQQKLPWSESQQSIREVIFNILLTRPGERLMRPSFGAGLTDYLQQPNNQSTRQLIRDVASAAIRRWETRIELLDVQVSTDAQDPKTLILEIHYQHRGTQATQQLQFSLSL
jgi:phage baseplate assembly protein W